jgi:hypothetical protein
LGGPNGLWSEIVDGNTTRAYIEGVPTVTTTEASEHVQRGLNAICQHLDQRAVPCDIVLLGFSRGAIIANTVASALNEFGCGPDGRHAGEAIALLGAVDPVNTAMGAEWQSPDGSAQPWELKVPDNVIRLAQVYKEQLDDPRSGIGYVLGTTPLWATDATYALNRMLAAGENDDSDWTHREVGSVDHGFEVHDILACEIGLAGIQLSVAAGSQDAPSPAGSNGWCTDGGSCDTSVQFCNSVGQCIPFDWDSSDTTTYYCQTYNDCPNLHDCDPSTWTCL